MYKKKTTIISACLLGIRCRYDGKEKPCQKAIELFQQGGLIPVCPEILGGLSTPRTPAERQTNKVLTKDGKDVTEQFNRGADEALKIAQLAGATKAILKAKSPSCGYGKIYNGTFTNTQVKGNGIFAEKCRQSGIEVQTEEEL